MNGGRIMVVLALAAVLALPMVVRLLGDGSPEGAGKGSGGDGRPAQRIVVLTPHIDQIRVEFGRAFAEWHNREFPADPPAEIDWRTPGGTGDILKQLQAQYAAAARTADADGQLTLKPLPDGKTVEAWLPAKYMGADMLFGGGSYEHTQLKRGVTIDITRDGKKQPVLVRLSEPAGFPRERLLASKDAPRPADPTAPAPWFGSEKIGNQIVFDPEQYWIGTALSSFGIVYNTLVLKELGLPEPTAFRDLTDPRYVGMLALADPRQSGSVTTTFESILNKEDWEEGWRTLRGLCANARYFTAASSKPPVDVSQGDAAAGVAIDFYGRGQAQALVRPGVEPSEWMGRVGYADPKGAVFIDPDPASILHACPNPVLIRRFLDFCMTEEGQALWQFPARSTPRGAANPRTSSGVALGPLEYELRRMPITPIMYAKYGTKGSVADAMVDKVNPYEFAGDLPDRRWRSALPTMMGAFGVDSADELRAAWVAFHTMRDRGRTDPASAATADRMEQALYAMPTGADVARLYKARFGDMPLPAGALLDFSNAITDTEPGAGGAAPLNPKKIDNCQRIVEAWKKDPAAAARLRIIYTEFFRERYREVLDIAASPAAAV